MLELNTPAAPEMEVCAYVRSSFSGAGKVYLFYQWCVLGGRVYHISVLSWKVFFYLDDACVLGGVCKSPHLCV